MKRPFPSRPAVDEVSVWDFPRPAIAEREPQCIRVELHGLVLARSRAAYRTLETSHPPSYYLPPGDVKVEYFRPSARTTFCEWKGQASYVDIVIGERVVPQAAWTYPAPTAAFACLKDHFAFYPRLMDACYVGDERAVPQPGQFYGGWITRRYVGPFKGEPGSMGW